MATLGSQIVTSGPAGELKMVSLHNSFPCRKYCPAVSSYFSSSVSYARPPSSTRMPRTRLGGIGGLHTSSLSKGGASTKRFLLHSQSKGLGRGLRKSIKLHTDLGKAFGMYKFRSIEEARWGNLCVRKHQVFKVFAKGTDDSLSPSEMTLETALKLLGVGEGATFDEILGAKKTLVDSSGGDQDRISQLEAAYDTLLMQSLSQRRRGKVLDNSIRYADVRKAKAAAAGGGPLWLKEALQKSPVAVQAPAANDLGLQTGVYGALVALTFATGLQPSSQMAIATGQDTPGFILAVGFGASLYFLRKQNVKLGKATLITIGGLVLGAVFGGGVESWLRVDIVPLFGIGSPSVIVSEFVLVSLYLTSLYLR